MADAVDVGTQADTYKFRKCTDMGNGERFADRCAAKMRWCHGQGWLWWDGKRWKRDTTQRVHREAKEVVRVIYAEASKCADDKMRESLAKWARSSESQAKRDAMVKAASSEPRLVMEGVHQLDAVPTALNVQNGTLSLRTLELVPHDPAQLLTKIARAAYDPEAKCEFWEATLAYFIPDKEQRRWVQMAAGYSMLGSYSEWLFIPYGSGANGKSTFLWALRDVLGDYACEAAPELLAERRERGAREDAALADLRGTRLVTTVETAQGKRMAEALMKQLTGESTIKAKFMRQDYFEFENQSAVWLATNHKPIVQGTDYAAWRRVRLIPFTVKIPEDQRLDPAEVKRALRDERDGILRWLMDGLRMYKKRGSLDPAPKAVMEATEEYKREMDAFSLWLDDCCVLEPNAIATVRAMRESYEGWCDNEGRTWLGSRNFNEQLRERGLAQEGLWVAGTKAKCWVGVKLNEAVENGNGHDGAESR